MLDQEDSNTNGRITPASHIGDVVIGGVEVHVAERITNLEAEISSRKEEITRLKATVVTTNRQPHRGIGNNIDGRSISPSFFNTTAKSDNNNEENSDNKEDEIAKVQNEVAVVKENARMLLKHMATMTAENEQLQSDLDRVREEMGDSLAEASAEIIQRGQALDVAQQTLAGLQTKYNDALEQLGQSDNSQNTIIVALKQELQMVETSSTSLKEALHEQIIQLKEELETTKQSSEDTINVQAKELRILGEEMRNEKVVLNAKIDKLRAGVKSMAMEMSARDAANLADNKMKSNSMNSNSSNVQNSLGDLATLWQEWLDDNRRLRGIADDGINTHQKPTDDTTLPNNDDGGLDSTILNIGNNIDHSTADDTKSVTSNDHAPSPSPRGRWFASWKKGESASSDSMVKDRDHRIDELEAVICSNVEIIKHIRRAIDEIDNPPEDKDDGATDTERRARAHQSTENLSQLKDALASLGSIANGDRLCPLLSTKNEDDDNDDIYTKPMKVSLADAMNGKLDEITTLQLNVRTLEETNSLLSMQNKQLSDDLSRLQIITAAVDTQSSSQEDEIEILKAKAINLELKCQIQADEKQTMEEALDVKLKGRDLAISNIEESHAKELAVLKDESSKQEDRIEQLQAEIHKLQYQSNMEEEQKSNEMKDKTTRSELDALEEEIPSSSSNFPDLL